ncbi:MAG: diaminopimelate epimerase [Syntrophomonadaceae bacterium]|nr:diaminopimelate epimerase [Syntrophomonadaceae bacterium]MDD3022356.1 diaminopimelate epimerase [Syntrophomonadaceae bacterium]
MNFAKMHGLGNNFIIIEASSWEEAGCRQDLAKALCDRNFGIGADGLVIVGNDNDMDMFMRIFNPDGSEPEMCGNGIRCAARYAYENKLVEKRIISVKTLAGPRYPEIIIRDGNIQSVRVDMGEPILKRDLIPMNGKGSNVEVPLQTGGQHFVITGVSMGNPHCIIFVEDINDVPINRWGPLIENHQIFPAKTNVEFVQVLGKNEIVMRVWERGAGVTLACGTGACATLVAAVLNDKSERKATIHLLGGDLQIEWSSENNHIYMTGPAVEVFKGFIEMDKLFEV